MPMVFVIESTTEHPDRYYTDSSREYQYKKVRRDIPVYGGMSQNDCLAWLFRNISPEDMHRYRIITNTHFCSSDKTSSDDTDNYNVVLNFTIKENQENNRYYIEFNDSAFKCKQEKKIIIYMDYPSAIPDTVASGAISITQSEFDSLLHDKSSEVVFKIEDAIMKRISSLSSGKITSSQFMVSNLSIMLANGTLKEMNTCI